MKSSSGVHFIALDHVRAVAAFMVFTWHFTHDRYGYPVPWEYTPSLFPLALLDEGHTGVALFMTLSGYLFAKLLEGKTIRYGEFLRNRALRLLPLLCVVIILAAVVSVIQGESLGLYANKIAQGVWRPTLPNGGWSITVEAHYYIILPFLLWMSRKSKWLPLSLVVAGIALRIVLHSCRGEIQSLAYWTIIGRIDQFTLGMLVYQFRSHLAHRHAAAATVLMMFSAIYWCFDWQGGFFGNPTYPSASLLWVVLPTIEGAAYAFLIGWYDNSFNHSSKGISKFLGIMGTYSYSIYLLHYFVVFKAAGFVHERIMDISNFYVACGWSAVLFLLMIGPGYISYRVVEAPFLKLRRPYVAAPVAGNSREAVELKEAAVRPR